MVKIAYFKNKLTEEEYMSFSRFMFAYLKPKEQKLVKTYTPTANKRKSKKYSHTYSFTNFYSKEDILNKAYERLEKSRMKLRKITLNKVINILKND